MTIVVGWLDGKNAWIGGDSGAFGESTVTITAETKVWKAENSLIGLAGSFRQAEIAKESGIGDPYALRDHLLTTWENRNNVPEDWGAEFLIVTQNEIFYITDDFAVVRSKEKYGAVGMGDGTALGALYAMQGVTMQPKDRISTALKASAMHGNYARPPFKIISL
jgi:ATP-dependent protease HslVU (ClpYQ) peptidase subunit